MNKSILILTFIFLSNNLFGQGDDVNFNLPESGNWLVRSGS